MIYNERVILISEKEVDDFLGSKKVKDKSQPIPCMRGSLTNAEQMGLFGKYDLNAFKLYLLGIHRDFSSIIFDGQERFIKGKTYHKNSTVIYL
ncbi:hypothetical protein [Streptococcus thoraltensis]|uniref:hypothetical protein n=1 Tax=Streptococcus thoraltensis TaxID=55085 RepID=UPI000363985B|nr:hypothetical protein [Streptococcus thoraltensis]QBX31111.1 hypothetical protein Javan616_0018 [Streptococcus phage Javan616]